ncbi:LPPG:FO 2-phospho-L-lactate transferase [Sphingobium herbicidovorans NBRC 16415]|uniref:LPPG:FO 2-phospho-L-lactate transferase n=1 Tax=Sphingobium herbicidovorans (strain ATCC 700291 / DSM 11019 / CCUG 56400 / KCTC 2939 / LMG 18315 / NBRC 16415 / MH) TaxID=1219045 RepID=A0A086P558_SPHHM|nr:2-phospho-L-lactate transferase [Sphingobium herbicidovorans]KFG88526.1 LPPG:FO 2-phospho-L-lactate transferase [Sphingobium herbicidovorans NBRC 16415]
MSRVVVLTGGVGGAKLVLGLMKVCPPQEVTAIVNTGDDFRHLGLAVSPDIDTLLYTLSGKANASQGWGREGESWSFMDALKSLGGEDWFLLGDGDLALHVLRSQLLAKGQTLSTVTARFAAAWGIELSIMPMSDDPVATHLATDEGHLSFQRYFVERRCAPAVQAIHFEGAEAAAPAPGVIDAITDPDIRAILIAPSNPWLSVDPILAVPGIRDALAAAKAPVVAVSPIVGGQAVKGPTTKLMAELGLALTNHSIANHYAGVIDGLLIDGRDDATGLPIEFAVTDTLMKTLEDRERVGRAVLALADRIAG